MGLVVDARVLKEKRERGGGCVCGGGGGGGGGGRSYHLLLLLPSLGKQCSGHSLACHSMFTTKQMHPVFCLLSRHDGINIPDCYVGICLTTLCQNR